MSIGVSVSSMYCVINPSLYVKIVFRCYFYNSDDVVTSLVKLKFSLTPFCKRQVVTPTVVDSHKCAWKNEEFKFRKRFTVFRIVNRFLKKKKAFTVKLKMISIDYHFWLH
jgi:hypothetical protein